jgi:hypothetical protein
VRTQAQKAELAAEAGVRDTVPSKELNAGFKG